MYDTRTMEQSLGRHAAVIRSPAHTDSQLRGYRNTHLAGPDWQERYRIKLYYFALTGIYVTDEQLEQGRRA